MLTLSPAPHAAPAAGWFVGRLPLVDDHRLTSTRTRTGRAGAAAVIRVEDVQEALRDYHRPSRLAASVLAPAAEDPAERAAAVRALLEDAVERAFGHDADEQLLRLLVQRAYFEGRAHEIVHWDLHISRATYFRRRRIAVVRIAEWLQGHAV